MNLHLNKKNQAGIIMAIICGLYLAALIALLIAVSFDNTELASDIGVISALGNA